MSRLKTLLKWEFNDVIKDVLFLLGLVLVGMSMKQSIMDVDYSAGFVSGISISLFGPSKSTGVLHAILGMMSLEDVWTLVGFLTLLLGALSFRYDRDSGVARSIYSLPYSNTEIFGVKLLSILVYSVLMVLLPFAYVTVTSYASIAGYLPEVTSGFMSDALIIALFLILYLVAVATFVSLASPNAFLAFMVGFTVVYAPKILGLESIPPALFTYALHRCGSTDFTPFTAQYLGWGIAVPLLLLGAALVLIRRRDVV
ncbi:ABC-2 transporter permease [Thermococcus nautili]|uniref:ABC-type transport system involved in multi-copper enzyme maturation, permease component n=1 Tax=Thermococcus nautili TaxID=195522 RepID=W8NTU1_9EURY|nr:ABC-2 transporter permease [Thermococcus nautili]AHL22557.1 hypothetical protein BD01_0938 [Thermococcus nautili]